MKLEANGKTDLRKFANTEIGQFTFLCLGLGIECRTWHIHSRLVLYHQDKLPTQQYTFEWTVGLMMKSERKFFRNLIKGNENITFQNLCDTTKAVLRRTYVCKCSHRKKRGRDCKQITKGCTWRQGKQEAKQSRWQGIKIRSEIN